MRLINTIVLLAVFIYCCYGFLATYELPGWPLLRTVYLFVGIGCLVGLGRLIFFRKLPNS